MIDEAWVKQNFPDLTTITKLGEGGQKLVFSAVHPSEGDVVLKVIKPTQDAERVTREIRAVQEVKSARVPSVLDTGKVKTASGEFIWLRERRIQGECLRPLLAKGPLTKDEVLRLGTHLLEALVDVERARLVHRDIKPENIIRDTNGDFWLIDFGYARHLDLSSLTATAALGGPGTLGYAPPEQYRNHKRDIDIRADLFALGVTLSECATGKHCFRDGARDPMEVVRRIETQPTPAFTVPGDTGGKIRDFLVTLMQRRPDHRIQTATDALTWLKQLP